MSRAGDDGRNTPCATCAHWVNVTHRSGYPSRHYCDESIDRASWRNCMMHRQQTLAQMVADALDLADDADDVS